MSLDWKQEPETARHCLHSLTQLTRMPPPNLLPDPRSPLEKWPGVIILFIVSGSEDGGAYDDGRCDDGKDLDSRRRGPRLAAPRDLD